MPKLYQMNRLNIIEIGEHTVYVDGGVHGPVPLHEAPDDAAIGDEVDAYVYSNASDELVATMARAAASFGQCAFLRVVSTGSHGTFLDWGLPKDLILPLSEQTARVRTGKSYAVYITADEYERPMASMKLHRYLEEENDDLKKGEAVELLIAAETDLGFKAVINDEYIGMIFHGELGNPLEIGARMRGWVKDFSEDGKINLTISALDSAARDELEERILSRLNAAEGRLYISDKSAPSDIFDEFGVSKKNFKRALGNLYKQRVITITPEYIELI
jgi:predicted RNA-binding protein (virulence factor B family)